MEYLRSPWRMTYITGQSPKPEGCLFCALLADNNDVENLILHRGATSYVILNLYPYNTGHLMVIPNAHTDTIEDMPSETLAETMALTQRVLAVLRAAYAPQGFNVGYNIGQVAGAGVPGHVHLHIVPRWAADSNFITTIGQTRVVPESMPDTYARLKALWDGEKGGAE